MSPYIEQDAREPIDIVLDQLESPIVNTIGDVNYILSSICKRWIDGRLWGEAGLVPSYQDINEVVGVLECVKQEFYDMVARPYEDQKRVERGDVY